MTDRSNQALWAPSETRRCNAEITRFAQVHAPVSSRVDAVDYRQVYQWSVDEPEAFWSAVWDFCNVKASQRGDRVLVHGDRMPGAQWFPEARLNYAENLLYRGDNSLAVIFRREDGFEATWSWQALRADVAKLAQTLRNLGLQPGDRVAAMLPNQPAAIIAMLATAAIGGVWSSSSPDFGPSGVIDRFGQITPKILFAVSTYQYGGKTFDCRVKLREILEGLPSVEHLILCDEAVDRAGCEGLSNLIVWSDLMAGHANVELEFVQLPFNHPLFILYSSGTTGKPKCIVHGAGGTLLQHLKEHRLHVDLKVDERLFYYTTCGWMMWNWMVSGLASGASLVLYDGAPMYPEATTLFDLAEAAAVNVFGVSAGYVDAARKAALRPKDTHKLDALNTVLSTGSPLAPESFDYVYDSVKEDVCLSSIAGGTDIVSCFMLGSPILPVYRGEIQCRGLGMRVAIYDDQGHEVRGQQGELVCTAPFPSMPLEFWNDPDGSRYRAAYFERYPGVWYHGDYAELTGHDGIVMYGRSDTVLNPGGVRIGTAEIYGQIDQIDGIIESVVIGQPWQGDIRVVLFVRLSPGILLDQALIDVIKTRIRRNVSPRHVPSVVLSVSGVPRTRSGKIAEIAVRDAVCGRPVNNDTALANPEVLNEFRDRPELA